MRGQIKGRAPLELPDKPAVTLPQPCPHPVSPRLIPLQRFTKLHASRTLMGPKQAPRGYFKTQGNNSKLLIGLNLNWSRRADLNR